VGKGKGGFGVQTFFCRTCLKYQQRGGGTSEGQEGGPEKTGGIQIKKKN